MRVSNDSVQMWQMDCVSRWYNTYSCIPHLHTLMHESLV
jgi:hypothetical protein